MGVALLVPRGLGEGASELDFPSVGRLAVGLAPPARRLFLHHRHSRPVHLHIQNGDGFAHHDRQIQLQGALHLPLLALRDMAADGLRRALHGFGRHR